MLAPGDRAESANLYRAALTEGRAVLREADRFFEGLGVGDRVPAERQRGTGLAGRAAVAKHSVARIDEGVAERLEPVPPRRCGFGGGLVVVDMTVNEEIRVHINL
jgi:hypothetical protein